MARLADIERSIQNSWLCALALFVAGCACEGGGAPLFPHKYRPQIAFAPVTPRPELLPPGATAFYPSFDGDTFMVMLPVVPQPEASPSEVLNQIALVLQAAGFERSLADLGIPAQPIHLPTPALAPLAEEICRESLLEQQPISQEVCVALRGGPVSAKAEAAVQNAFGVSYADLKADLERPGLQYVFLQLVDGVLIEGSGVLASGREGESISSVHGLLYNRYVVTNKAGEERAVLEIARRKLAESLKEVPSMLGGSVHVLLPFGSQRQEDIQVTALRHSWRVLLGAEGGSWLAWIDAETGAILRLAPQWDEATPAQGERWRRDPGLLPDSTRVVDFEVDPPSGGRFTLELDNSLPRVFLRFDRLGNGFGADEVSVTATAASATANFNVSSINDETTAICDNDSGHNPWYRQVNAYSHLYSFWKETVSAGTIPAFPEKPIQVRTDMPGSTNIAYYDWDATKSVLHYIAGEGSSFDSCPDIPSKRLNGATDATLLIHEMTHLSVKRLQDRRPAGWCLSASGSCGVPSPEGRVLFHDFADAFASHYAAIDCVAGWSDKNVGFTNASLYCNGSSDEAGGFPRRFEAGTDHFPEHRTDKGGYADGQIAAAGLWGIRQGMRSKEPTLGTVAFLIRLQRALWDFGLARPVCTSCTGAIRERTCTAGCDRDIYQYLQDLEKQMVKQWAILNPSAGWNHSANKVLSGWAAVGIFLVPYSCMDSSTSTKDVLCPTGSGGGDAVIDVLDGDPSDDSPADGVVHPEWDYLKRLGSPPRFRVWTGPVYRFDATGKALVTGSKLCHRKYTVEVSTSNTFSDSRSISGTTLLSNPCHANVELPVGVWEELRGSSGDVRLFYRVKTRSAANGEERISTKPGAGAFSVPAPFFVVNETGKP